MQTFADPWSCHEVGEERGIHTGSHATKPMMAMQQAANAANMLSFCASENLDLRFSFTKYTYNQISR